MINPELGVEDKILEREAEGASCHCVTEEYSRNGGKVEKWIKNAEQRRWFSDASDFGNIFRWLSKKNKMYLNLNLWPWLSKVTSSLHLLAMFQRVCCQQCVCKLYLTFLNVCFHNGSSYLCNTTFCRDVRPSNAVPFFLHACVVFCCNYRFWKLRTYFMLLWVSVGPLQVCFQFLFYILLSVLSDVILTLWEIRLTLYLESNLEFL